jgi:hypothetical protein
MKRHGFGALFLVTCSTAWLVATAAPAMAEGDEKDITATGEAAVFSGDAVAARDRAIGDAQRRAVEQAVGTMISAESLTVNYELVTDKILSKAVGYVRSYKIINEDKGKENDPARTYKVTVQAKVSAGEIDKDMDGIKTMLSAKQLPRILVMVAEQNIGDPNAEIRWQANMDSFENSFMEEWLKKGFKFVDRQALQGKIKVASAFTGAEPSADAVKEMATGIGADVVIYGKAIASNQGAIAGTQMLSIKADVTLRLLNLDSAQVIATSTQNATIGHINPQTGGVKALQKAAAQASKELLTKVLAQWQQDVHGAATVNVTISNVKQSRDLKTIANFLKEEVRGVEAVRQRAYKAKVAELEVDVKASVQELADELEGKKFKGFKLEIDEFTANTIKATMK